MNVDGLIAPFLYYPLKHAYRLIFDPEYRYYSWLVARYGRTKRFQRRNVRVHGWNLVVPDVASFFSAFKEIFVEGIYSFPSSNQKPIILDCGANIGLGILYFKKMYPQSRVIAYEADPDIFDILKKNILSNGIEGVEFHNKAVWSSFTTVNFHREGADAGRIDIGSDKNLISIPAVSLASLIESQSFDLVKIDIEGAEVEALQGCAELLDRLHFIFVEFHSFSEKRQALGTLITAFERYGFKVHIHSPFMSKRPFHKVQENYGMDMQLNLFFWKDRQKT